MIFFGGFYGDIFHMFGVIVGEIFAWFVSLMFACFHENCDFLLVLCFPMILLVFTSSSVHLLSVGCHIFPRNFNEVSDRLLNCI